MKFTTKFNYLFAIYFYYFHAFCRFTSMPISMCTVFNQMVLARRLVPGVVCMAWLSTKTIFLEFTHQ